jgi:PadR family transcriptional regulator PadR
MAHRKSNPEFVNGIPELLILARLARRPMHGYELVRAIEQSTGSVLGFGEGCVYPVLHALEAQGYLSSRALRVVGRRRRVYAVTPRGRQRLRDASARWRHVTEAVRRALTPSLANP